MEKKGNVDQFIADSAAAAQPILTALRELIMASFPDIDEKIGYGVPQYKWGKVHLGLSVAKAHVTVGFDYGAIAQEMRIRLEAKGYKLGLQTLQIKFTQPIPREELREIFSGLL